MAESTQFAALFRLVKFRPPTLPEQQVMSHSRQGLKMRSRNRHKMHPTTHGARTLPNSGPPRHHAHSVRSPCMCAARRGCSMECCTDSACGVLMCPKSVRNYYSTLNAHNGDQNVAIRWQATPARAYSLAGMADVEAGLKLNPQMRQELDQKWSYMGLMFGHT